LLTLLQKFKNLSGLEVNTTKTVGMLLGRWQNKAETSFGFRWPWNSINAFGILFSYDETKPMNYVLQIKSGT